MPPEHPFKKLSKAAYHERAENFAQTQYESDKVKLTLKKLNLTKLVKTLWYNSNYLTFDMFNNEFPTFPLLLGTARIQGVHTHPRAQLPSLIKSFELAPFVEKYEYFYELNQERASNEGRLIGMVFPYKGIPSGLVIYTTDSIESLNFSEKEFFLIYLSGKNKKDRSYLILRSFSKTLEAIYNSGHGWKPS